MKLEGNKKYRHKDNPDEKVFHDKFISMYINPPRYVNQNALDFIIFGATDAYQNTPKDYLSDREKEISINLIQWLGSPVGQSFLRDCGFEKVKK